MAPTMRILASVAVLVILVAGPAVADDEAERAFTEISALDPIAREPGDASAAPMTVGNGAFCAGVSVAADGALMLELGHADARGADGRSEPLGRVRVALEPPLPTIAFAQRWHLAEGFVAVSAGLADDRVRIEVFVDPELPVLHLVLASGAPRRMRASVESLPSGRTLRTSEDEPDALVWYGRNEESIVPELLANLGLEEHASSVPDLLILRTYGCRMEGGGFARAGDDALALVEPSSDAALRIGAACAQADGLSSWLSRLAIATAVAPDAREARLRATRWWRDRFARSWVLPGDRASAVAWLRARAERLACGGGALPSGCATLPWHGRTVDPPSWPETRDAHRALAPCGDGDRLAAIADLHVRALPVLPLLPTDLEGDRLDAAVALLGVARADPAAARGVELLALLLDAWEREAADSTAPDWGARVLPLARAVLSEGPSGDARGAELAARLLVLAAATAHPDELARWSRIAGTGGSPVASVAVTTVAPSADPCARARFATDVSRSLVRPARDATLLLPHWPVGWDVAFRLAASGGLTATGRIERGVIVGLRVTDGTRDRPFEVGEPWRARDAAALPATSR